jgi:probable rRNA maturation factor
MPLSIENRQRVLRLDTPSIRRLVRLILEDHNAADGDLTVVFARDPFVRELNASYRDMDRATDVLAFATADAGPADVGTEPEGLERILGDVVISVDRAVAQARRYRRTPESEVLKLVAHGVLHLVGHDHAGTKDRAGMRRLENRYLRAVAQSTR